MNSLVLASGSASRARMLRAAGVPFTAAPADLDETGLVAAMRNADGAAVALALAEAKALAVARSQDPGSLVLGADTVIVWEGKILGKCPDMAAARKLLEQMNGRAHGLVSAAVLARGGKIVWHHAGHATLTVRPFSPAFLDAYLAAEGPAILSSVGCYRYEGRGAQLFDRVEGDYFCVLGLPLLPLLAALRREGVIAS
jgi:septum formation protein